MGTELNENCNIIKTQMNLKQAASHTHLTQKHKEWSNEVRLTANRKARLILLIFSCVPKIGCVEMSYRLLY